jgi:hypothetical protein
MPHSVIVKGLDKVVYFYETPVTHPGWEPIMLFDLASDVGEYENIYPLHPVRAQALYADMTNYLAAVGARIPLVPNPAYNAAAYQADDDYDYRMSRGPFVGTRAQEEDAWPASFLTYWMGSWGMDIGPETHDFDGDGLVNWGEYATGGDPTNALDVGAVPRIKRAGATLDYAYAQRNDDSDLVYTVESTTDLSSGIWTFAGGSAETNLTAGTFDTVDHRLLTADGHACLRLRVERR